MKKGKRFGFVYSIGTGFFTVFLFLLFYLAANKNVAPFMLILREVFPFYNEGFSHVNLYAFGEYTAASETGAEIEKEIEKEMEKELETEIIAEISPVFEESSPDREKKSADIEYVNEIETKKPEIIGIGNVVFQPETDLQTGNNSQTLHLTKADIQKLTDFDYLKTTLYTIDKRTGLLPQDIDVNGFIEKNFVLERGEGPKILIMHTHSQEGYADSEEGDLRDGVFIAGERLSELLRDKYGIAAIHDESSYDIVDGVSSTLGAYERMEASVTRILEENPSIEIVIDLHRDGVAEDVRFVTNIDGKPTAKIMFFNGLCRIYDGGELLPTEGLSNPYVNDNLAFSFNLQLLANELYPGFTRKIYINAYRYSLHFKPKSLLVEVGAQTNTKEEALNAMEPLAEILAKTVKH